MDSAHRGLIPDTELELGFSQGKSNTKCFKVALPGEWLDAQRAYEIGYVTQIVDPEYLMKAAIGEAKTFERLRFFTSLDKGIALLWSHKECC